jgi:hypothetical protein
MRRGKPPFQQAFADAQQRHREQTFLEALWDWVAHASLAVFQKLTVELKRFGNVAGLGRLIASGKEKQETISVARVIHPVARPYINL